MTSRAEDVLYSSLIDVEALEKVAKIGIDPIVLPTSEMRPVVTWALDYFDATNQSQAPTRAALLETWGEVIEQAEVEIAEEDVELDDVEWAVNALKSKYIEWKFQQWQKEAAVAMAEAKVIERMDALELLSQELTQLTLQVRDRRRDVEGVDGFRQSLAAYEKRAAEAGVTRGLTFGVDVLDEYTYGIHEGEVAVLAAGPKTGKSVGMAYALLNEWRRERTAIYYTLENSVEMTYDRLVCMLLAVDHDRYRRGECTPEEFERVQQWLLERGDALKDLIRVVRPDRSEMTVQWMMRHARSFRADTVMIDQLTFISPSHRSLRGHEAVKDIMHSLKDEAAFTRHPVPVLLAHQINREGIKAAAAQGFLELHMLAEGAEVERTADWVFGLYASNEERTARAIKWQTMAGRRASQLRSWRLAWRPWIGQVDLMTELELTT